MRRVVRFATISDGGFYENPELSVRQEGDRVLHWKVAAVLLFALLMLPESSIAQSSLLKRINKVKEVSIWQRKPLGQKESRQVLQDLKSSDRKTMQAAFETLALSRPLPAFADLVVAETQASARRSKDKFATAMAFYIKHDWNEAKRAAETLQSAKRSGGFRYLEQVVVRGNTLEAGVAMLAVAYSGNSRAGIVVGQYWLKSKIPGLRALLIVGPPAADTLATQLNDEDYFVVKDVIEVLGKIGSDALHSIGNGSNVAGVHQERGFANARRFSWAACAQAVQGIIEQTGQSMV